MWRCGEAKRQQVKFNEATEMRQSNCELEIPARAVAEVHPFEVHARKLSSGSNSLNCGFHGTFRLSSRRGFPLKASLNISLNASKLFNDFNSILRLHNLIKASPSPISTVNCSPPTSKAFFTCRKFLYDCPPAHHPRASSLPARGTRQHSFNVSSSSLEQ